MSNYLPHRMNFTEPCRGRVLEAEQGWARLLEYKGKTYSISAQPQCCGRIKKNDVVGFNFMEDGSVYIHHVLMQPGMKFPVSFEETAEGELVLKRGRANIYFKEGCLEIDNGAGAKILLDEKGNVHLGRDLC